MYVLGINGWNYDIHDPSACLFLNGELIAAAEEERFIRQKKALDKLPYNSIAYCLKEANITPDQVDHIVMGWDVKKIHDQKYSKTLNEKACIEMVFPTEIFPRENNPQLHMCSHHLAHAAGAFFSSGYEESAILVIDGSGEEESITIAKGKGNKIEILEQFPLNQSLGIFYEALTVFAGLGRHNEGKLMGLSSYGEAVYEFPDILEGQLSIQDKNISMNSQYFSYLKNWIGVIQDTTNTRPNTLFYKYDVINTTLSTQPSVMDYKDIAASGQVALEKAIVKLVNKALRLTDSKNICISGGVALNCVANRVVANLKSVKKIYIQPGASDSGVSIGAASWFISENNIKPIMEDNHVYSGPQFSDSMIYELLTKYNIPFIELGSNKYEKCAELLGENKVLGRFSGRMEFGPRALGNRSIIANPNSKKMLKKVNTIKKREQWRPLAPSLIKENVPIVLEEENTSPFMLLNSTVKENIRHLLPAIVHVDGSSRPQVVTKEMNNDYYETIQSFYKKTDIPAIMNTSFNVGNEPIVCNPNDAIKSFYGSELDGLLLGSFLINKGE
ncbi:carbamoyltransferase [Metabacillus idriensis]|uniref:carbamoyltransferase family protein n=1 Tax=Metabacillus idriensis TaxID=324768 RepID=UPI00174A8E52|nr:carbamoyltransferase C-terminal domain-containing protein [Metabacillus idriensis]